MENMKLLEPHNTIGERGVCVSYLRYLANIAVFFFYCRASGRALLDLLGSPCSCRQTGGVPACLPACLVLPGAAMCNFV